MIPMQAVTTIEIPQVYAERLAERLGNALARVSLFGSRARGDASHRSDFDLMIVLHRPSGAHRDAVHGLAVELELDHNVDLSTKIVDEARFEELRRSNLPFWRRFERDERILWPPSSSTNG
jgi:predicted nucleotidyltransferase